MRLTLGDPRSSRPRLIGSTIAFAAVLAVVLAALGVPGQVSCGGAPEPETAPMRSALYVGGCVEQTGTHAGTCEEIGQSGRRACKAEPLAAPLACPAGCVAGATSYSWKDVFGDEVRANPKADKDELCALRKPPGIDCTYVEHLACAPSK